MSNKRPRDESDDGALERCIAEANRLIGKRPWFVCYGCDALCLGHGKNMETSKWGYERVFCAACVAHCNGCDTYYVESMAYRHEECSNDDDEEEEDS